MAINKQRLQQDQLAAPAKPEDAQQPPQEAVQEPVGSQPAEAPQQEQFSPNAQRRFSELTETLRRKDQELQNAIAKSKQLEESHSQAQNRIAEIEKRLNAMLNQQLLEMDEDTRRQVLQKADFEAEAAKIEQRIASRFQPVLEQIATESIRQELQAVSRKYPGFNLDVHGPLIEIFRQKNPNCSLEQAFRAVAEPEELVQQAGRAPAVPPIAVPNQGNQAPRYVPQPQPNQKTPDQELEELRQQAFELARSDDPLKRRLSGQVMDRYIKQRMGPNLPGRR